MYLVPTVVVVLLTASSTHGNVQQKPTFAIPYTCTTTSTTTQSCKSGGPASVLTQTSASSSRQNEPAVVIARPGKRGIPGPKGEKGDSCSCAGQANGNLDFFDVSDTTSQPTVKGEKGEKGDPCQCGDGDTETMEEIGKRLEKFEGELEKKTSVTTIPDAADMKKIRGRIGQLEAQNIVIKSKINSNSEGLESDERKMQEMQSKINRLEEELERVKNTKTENTGPGSRKLMAIQKRIEKLEADNLAKPSDLEPINSALGSLAALPSKCSEINLSESEGSNLESVIVYPLKAILDFTPYVVNCSGGGWITIQRRFNGSVDFDRTWGEYADGFGDEKGEFWIGLQAIHRLNMIPSKLRIDMTFMDGSARYAEYDAFFVTITSHYQLTIGHYSGNAGDLMSVNNKKSFTTYDRDFDDYYRNCAKEIRGGWWYSKCGTKGSPNAKYGEHFKWGEKKLMRSEMKIRPHCS